MKIIEKSPCLEPFFIFLAKHWLALGAIIFSCIVYFSNTWGLPERVATIETDNKAFREEINEKDIETAKQLSRVIAIQEGHGEKIDIVIKILKK